MTNSTVTAVNGFDIFFSLWQVMPMKNERQTFDAVKELRKYDEFSEIKKIQESYRMDGIKRCNDHW